MPKFRVVWESTKIDLLAKVFEAKSLEEAIEMSKAEACEGPDAEGWELFDQSANCEVREDQCGGPLRDEI